MGITNPLYWRENSATDALSSPADGQRRRSYHPKEWLKLSYAASLNRASQDYEHFGKERLPEHNSPGLFGALATEEQQAAMAAPSCSRNG